MFIELLRKEFIEKRSQSDQSLTAQILLGLLKFVFLGAGIFLECFIWTSLDEKIQQYSEYGTFDFLVLFLFAFFLLSSFFTMIKARKTIFDKKDNRVTMPLPISPSTQITAKVVYLYAETALFHLLTSTPILISYFALRIMHPYYYVFAICYPLLISFASTGLALLLSIVFQLIYTQIKKSDIAQVISASVLVILLCYIYQFILDLFLTALNDSSIGGVFSSDFVLALHYARVYLQPVFPILDCLIDKAYNIMSQICIFLGFSFLLDIVSIALISLIFFRELRKEDKTSKKKKREKELKLLKPFKALLKKEMILLFKDESNLFSYTSLLIMCPFLTFVVISSLNDIIYDNLRFYATYFPELISGINLALILIFVGVINASASLSMTREGKALKIVKTIPLSPLKQILAKLLIPVSFSEFSLLLTILVLIGAGIITVPVFFSSFFIGTLILLFSNVFGVYADMHDMTSEKRKVKLTLVNELVPLLLPILLFLLFFLLSVLARLSAGWIYLIACLFSLLVLSPVCIHLKSRYQKAFLNMEVSN